MWSGEGSHLCGNGTGSGVASPSSASVQGAVLTLCLICLLSFLHRTNSDSALHTSAMNPNPQNPFGMNQQMGRGPPQRNGKGKMQAQDDQVALNPTYILEV